MTTLLWDSCVSTTTCTSVVSLNQANISFSYCGQFGLGLATEKQQRSWEGGGRGGGGLLRARWQYRDLRLEIV